MFLVPDGSQDVYAVILLLLIAAPMCSAQFSSLATNSDGSVLYFVSTLRQTGTDQPGWGKVFRADSGGIRLYSSLERSTPPSYFNLGYVDVSGDGRLVSRTAFLDCSAGPPVSCTTAAEERTVVDGGGTFDGFFD